MAHADQASRSLDDIEEPGAWRVSTFYLLHLEFLGPSDDWTPHDLIEQHNHQDHDSDAPENSLRVARTRRGLQVRAQPGQAEVARAQHEHLAGHEKEPAARNRHHRIPYQANGSIRKLELRESLIPAEAVNLGGFAHVARNALQRRIEAEGHVPYLPGENQQDRPHFDADLVMRK